MQGPPKRARLPPPAPIPCLKQLEGFLYSSIQRWLTAPILGGPHYGMQKLLEPGIESTPQL